MKNIKQFFYFLISSIFYILLMVILYNYNANILITSTSFFLFGIIWNSLYKTFFNKVSIPKETLKDFFDMKLDLLDKTTALTLIANWSILGNKETQNVHDISKFASEFLDEETKAIVENFTIDKRGE